MSVAVRVDGGAGVGYGHLVRTSALSRTILRRGHRVTCATTAPDAVRSVHPDSVDVLTLSPESEQETFLNWVADNQPDVVVTDSYDIDTAYQRSLNELVSCLTVVTDDTRHTISADVVVNGNVYAPELEYEYEGNKPEWYLGLDYLLLREEIRTRARREPPWRDPPERAIVTMGGSDIRGTTPEVLPAFDDTDLIVDVIVGPGFDKQTERKIEQTVAATDADLRLARNPPDLAERMFESDLAVSATGSTSYELLALGTPTIGIPQANNQVPIAKALSERGAMVASRNSRLEELSRTVHALASDGQRRQALRDRGKSLIDGQGTERVADALLGAR